MIKLKRFLPVVLLSMVVLIPSKAYAAHGRIIDNTENRQISGVWVEVYGGQSGWARLQRFAEPIQVDWSYNTHGKPYSLHIGVGGTEEDWAHNLHTEVLDDSPRSRLTNIYYTGVLWNRRYVVSTK